MADQTQVPRSPEPLPSTPWWLGWPALLIAAVSYLLLRLITWQYGLPPLEWAVPVLTMLGAAALYGVFKPVLLLFFIATGSLLGNLVHIAEEGLIPFSLFQIFYLAGLGLFVLKWFMNRCAPVRLTGLEIELALFFSLVFLSLLWTPDAERGFLHAIRVFALSGLLYLFVNWIDTPRQITWLVVSLVAVGGVLALIAIYNTINNPLAIIVTVLTDGSRVAARARVGQVDPNIFASLFFLPLSFTASVAFSRMGYSMRATGAVAFLVLFAAVLVTYSRSAWVAVLLTTLVLAVMNRQYGLFIVAAAGVALLLAVYPDARMLLSNVLERFVRLFTGGVDTSNMGRIMLLDGSIRIFFDSWLIGVGWRGFPDAFLNYYTLQQTLGVYEPHNVLYLVYAELGLIGLLLFVFIVYKLFWLAWNNISMSYNEETRILSQALFGALLAYAVFYQFIGSGFLDNQLWITTGLIIALRAHLSTTGE